MDRPGRHVCGAPAPAPVLAGALRGTRPGTPRARTSRPRPRTRRRHGRCSRWGTSTAAPSDEKVNGGDPITPPAPAFGELGERERSIRPSVAGRSRTVMPTRLGRRRHRRRYPRAAWYGLAESTLTASVLRRASTLATDTNVAASNPRKSPEPHHRRRAATSSATSAGSRGLPLTSSSGHAQPQDDVTAPPPVAVDGQPAEPHVGERRARRRRPRPLSAQDG